MKALYLASCLALALFVPATSYAASAEAQAAARSGKTVAQSSVRAINNQTAVGCNICFTCGGDWPVFAGSIRSVGDFPTERGSGCSGPLQGRADGSPFLCCR
ncbi:MAG: hypothetical protein U1E17_23135 [Geminicoccaceae bacterium]